jgi:hypothetical protein
MLSAAKHLALPLRVNSAKNTGIFLHWLSLQMRGFFTAMKMAPLLG